MRTLIDLKPHSPPRFAALIAMIATTTGAAGAQPIAPTCDAADIAPGLVVLLRAQRFADVHHAALAVRALCGPRGALDAIRLLDDIALLRLDDRTWALHDLQDLAAGRSDAARVVLAWTYLDDGDREAATVALARLPSPRAAAVATLGALDDRAAFARRVTELPAPMIHQVRELGARYHAAGARSPVVAGLLSGLVPGAGQIYAGSWQAAAVTFVLNGLFVTSTIELARERYYFTAAATATAASFFYVGGIMNAVDLARRRNQLARQPSRAALEELLVPELYGSFAVP